MAFIYYVTQIQFDFGAVKLLKQECDIYLLRYPEQMFFAIHYNC